MQVQYKGPNTIPLKKSPNTTKIRTSGSGSDTISRMNILNLQNLI